jgi:hypothetical protein
VSPHHSAGDDAITAIQAEDGNQRYHQCEWQLGGERGPFIARFFRRANIGVSAPQVTDLGDAFGRFRKETLVVVLTEAGLDYLIANRLPLALVLGQVEFELADEKGGLE